MLSPNYPIIHTFSGGSVATPMPYSILIGTTVIYTGKVYSPDGSEVSVDIAPITREYLEVFAEDLPLKSEFTSGFPSNNLIASRNTFTVQSDFGSAAYDVGYNYNKEWVSELGDSLNLNLPIQTDIDPRQFIGLSAFGMTTFEYSINDGPSQVISVTSPSAYASFQRRVSSLSSTPGDKITLSNNGVSHNFKVVPECSNTYSLIYVNSLGGLDYLLVRGKASRSYSVARYDSRDYMMNSDSLQFEQRRIHSDIHQHYDLNTGMILPLGLKNISELIYSPKVWIHDIESDDIRAVIVDTNSVSELTERWDRPHSYSFRVQDSKIYTRK